MEMSEYVKLIQVINPSTFTVYNVLYIFLCSVSLKFGVVTMLSGLIGVPLGSYAAQKFRIRNGRADPL